MMDYGKLIERLNTKLQSYAPYTDSKLAHVLEDITTVIETLCADLACVTAERDAAVKDLNEILGMDELCPIQCKWCKWQDASCSGKMPEWCGPKEEG